MDPIAVRAEEAARMLSISVRKLREMTPELPHVRVGRCVLYPVAGLTDWLSRMARAGRK